MFRTNYFYIDEAGTLGNDSKIFIHGCIKTDNSVIIEKALLELRKTLIEDLYFEGFIERIKQEGFHAVENHHDIKTQFYRLLPFLDYRAYFVILDKTTPFYTQLKQKKNDYEIFEYTLTKLLSDRIVKNKTDKNIFYFERINIEKKALSVILKDFFSSLDSSYDCEYHIVGKEEENLAVVDYLNYMFFQILEDLKNKKVKKNLEFDRMMLNFNLVKSKIGLINIVHSDTFLSRKKKFEKRIEYDNLIKEFGG